MNQTLVFNTTTKFVKVYAETPDSSQIIYAYDNVPTVGIRPEGYYEVMQKDEDKSYPVLRLPIATTNMQIVK
jgi:hypothetical protein